MLYKINKIDLCKCGHMPQLSVGEPERVKKVVVKVEVTGTK